jgi:hypothetical protein
MAESSVRINFQATDQTKPAVRSTSEGLKEIQGRIKELQQIQREAAKSKLTAPDMASYKTASEDLKAVTKDLTLAQKELGEASKILGSDLNNGAMSAKGMFTSFTAATLAANAIQSALSNTKTYLQDSIKVAEQYNTTMMGLGSAAHAFGENAREVQQAAKSAAADGIVPLASNAAALRDLLQSGLSLDQATEMLARMKDEAAFGRANTVEYGTAVENLAQAFKTEQSALGNLSGHTSNFSDALEVGAAAMGKNVAALTDAERLQAKYIGYLQQGSYAQGDAARYAATSAGEQAKLNYQQMEAQRILGTGLLPAVTMMRQGFVQMITGGIQPTQETTQQLQGTFLALATGVRLAMNSVIGFGRGVMATVDSIRTGSLKPLQDAAAQTNVDFVRTFQDMDDGFLKISQGAYEASDGTQQAMAAAAEASSKATQKMNQDVAEANKQFLRSQAQRLKDFREAMDDMVIAHRDKTRAIEADIAEETKAYKDALIEREADLKNDLAKLEDQHGKKVSDITKKITDERNRGIILDGVRYANANEEKIAELQAELVEEQSAYQQSIDERKTQYDQDVANDKAKHDAQLLQLNTALAEERAILQHHAAEVAAVGEREKEDDISRLKRKFAEENALAELNHREQVAKIWQQGNEQGTAYGSGIANGIRNQSANLGKASEVAFGELMKGVERGVASGGLKMGGGGTASGQGIGGGVLSGLVTGFLPGVGSALKLLGFAEGGTINRPTLLVDKASGRPYGEMAERGPEDIVPRGGVRQGLPKGGMTVTIGEQHFHSNLDQSSFLRQMYWEGRR